MYVDKSGKGLQYFPQYSKNRVIFVPYFSGTKALGEFCVNGEKVVAEDFTQFIEILKQIKVENKKTLIHTKNLNYWLALKGKFVSTIFTLEKAIGQNHEKIYMLQTTSFMFIELADVIDFKWEDGAKEIDDLVLSRMRDGLFLPQIAFSYAYGSYKIFLKQNKEAHEAMKPIVMKHIKVNLNQWKMFEKSKKVPSIIWTTPARFTLFSATDRSPIYYMDRHDCWDYYLLTGKFPLCKRTLISNPTFNNVMSLFKAGKQFEAQMRILFEKDYEPDSIIQVEQIKFLGYTEEENSVYEFCGNEVDFLYLKTFYDVSKIIDIKVEHLYYYEESGKLPKAYCKAIEGLITNKHLAPAGSIEKLRAKEALKIQIGKGIANLPLFGVEVEDNELKTKAIGLNDADLKSRLYNRYKNIMLSPQISLRCQAYERLHIVKVVRDLMEMECEIYNVDTDGIIYQDFSGKSQSYFKKLNENIKETYELCDFMVGQWDMEHQFKNFMSFGKKEYVGQELDGTICSTLAGCNRKLDVFNFKVAEETGEVVVPGGRTVIDIDVKKGRIVKASEDFVLKLFSNERGD